MISSFLDAIEDCSMVPGWLPILQVSLGYKNHRNHQAVISTSEPFSLHTYVFDVQKFYQKDNLQNAEPIGLQEQECRYTW